MRRRLSPVTYIVSDGSSEMKRHVDQLFAAQSQPVLVQVEEEVDHQEQPEVVTVAETPIQVFAEVENHQEPTEVVAVAEPPVHVPAVEELVANPQVQQQPIAPPAPVTRRSTRSNIGVAPERWGYEK